MTPRLHRLFTFVLAAAFLGQCAGLGPHASELSLSPARPCLEQVAP